MTPSFFCEFLRPSVSVWKFKYNRTFNLWFSVLNFVKQNLLLITSWGIDPLKDMSTGPLYLIWRAQGHCSSLEVRQSLSKEESTRIFILAMPWINFPSFMWITLHYRTNRWHLFLKSLFLQISKVYIFLFVSTTYW